MSSPAEMPTAVVIMSIFPAGEPGKVKIAVNQRGKVKLTRSEAAWLLTQSALMVGEGRLIEDFPEQV